MLPRPNQQNGHRTKCFEIFEMKDKSFHEYIFDGKLKWCLCGCAPEIWKWVQMTKCPFQS